MAEDASTFVIALTTMPDDEEQTAKLARTLVERRLAACVSVLAPMQSTYRWQGAIEQQVERQVVIKTTAARVAELKQAMADLHPYDVPELLIVRVEDGAEAYLRWVDAGVGRAG